MIGRFWPRADLDLVLTPLLIEKIVSPECAQLERITQSTPFRTSEIHRALLAYLVEKSLSGEADSVKEYTIGLEVFRKPPSYDPRQESTVRMHVSRVRQKLDEYYQTEGSSDPVIIGLPKGAFKISFAQRAELSVPNAPPAESSGRRDWRVWAAGFTVVLIIAVAFGMHYWRRNTTQSWPRENTELDRLWEPLLSSERPLIVCLSNAPLTPELTAAGTAGGAFLLGKFFASRKKDASIENGNQVSIVELAIHNVVFIGPAAGNRNIQRIMAGLDLVLEPAGIRNLTPRPGENATFIDHLADDADLEESYALVTHMPGLNGDGDALYFSGSQVGSVVGAVRTFSDPSWAGVLASGMKDASGAIPRYYQAVLKVRSMDGTPVDISYMTHRIIDRARFVSATRRQ
jgi:hypothetical protein